jgi:hypothetical protein
MTATLVTNPTENKYQQALSFYKQGGVVSALKRQWEFIREPDQSWLLVRTIGTTAATVYYCTCKGVRYGKEVADYFQLKNKERDVIAISGGGAGFATGLVIGITLNGVVIEHSARLENWKNVKVCKIIETLMRQEFERDPILSQFQCAISQGPIFVPTRTPAGQVFDYSALLGACDENGYIKDIYNKRIATPTSYNPNSETTIRYSIDACLKDKEMTIVIYKRFRHLATQKAGEEGLSQTTKVSILDWRNDLGEFVRPLYQQVEQEILKKRNDEQSKQGITEADSELAETRYNDEMGAFKKFFGANPLSNIDWAQQNDWAALINARWMSKYHV